MTLLTPPSGPVLHNTPPYTLRAPESGRQGINMLAGDRNAPDRRRTSPHILLRTALIRTTTPPSSNTSFIHARDISMSTSHYSPISSMCIHTRNDDPIQTSQTYIIGVYTLAPRTTAWELESKSTPLGVDTAVFKVLEDFNGRCSLISYLTPSLHEELSTKANRCRSIWINGI